MKALKSARDLTPFSLRSFFSASRSSVKLNLLESFYSSKEVYTVFLTQGFVAATNMKAEGKAEGK